MPTTKKRPRKKPAAKPAKKRSYKGRRKKIDPVQVQVSIMVPRIMHKGKRVQIKPAVVQEAIQQWADTGTAPDGFEIKGVEWENYGRHKERRYADDEESIEEARLTLKLGQLFRGRYVKFSALRYREGATQAKSDTTGLRRKTRTGNKTAIRGSKNRRSNS